MVKILTIERQPIHEIPFQCASSGKRDTTEKTLPIQIAIVDRLPSNLAAIIVTSDLQGIDRDTNRLIGHRVAEELEILADDLKLIPNSLQTGVILAGDLYATLDRRGGLGDVRSIWQDFRRRFRWVAGVAGNHDSFGTNPTEFDEFTKTSNLYYLDDRLVRVDELDIAGISGIIGAKQKILRRPEKVYRKIIRDLIAQFPDILILHENPLNFDLQSIDCRSLLTICGHIHWREPLVDLSQGGQILNVNERVIVLTVDSR